MSIIAPKHKLLIADRRRHIPRSSGIMMQG